MSALLRCGDLLRLATMETASPVESALACTGGTIAAAMTIACPTYVAVRQGRQRRVDETLSMLVGLLVLHLVELMWERRGMSPAIYRFATLVPAPWRNGGGTTREVAAAPPTPGRPDFDWRVSVADVDRPGPFSAFTGVDRTIVLVEGPGLVLEVDGVFHELAALAPFSFRGEAVTTCRLPAGRTRDLNVMTRRGRTSADVVVVEVAGQLSLAANGADEVLVVVLAGQVSIPTGSDATAALEALDTAHWRHRSTIGISGRGSVAVIRLNVDRH